jgi:hypothetical protein
MGSLASISNVNFYLHLLAAYDDTYNMGLLFLQVI